MNVTNLDSATFGVTDLATCRRFWTTLGSSRARRTALRSSLARTAAPSCCARPTIRRCGADRARRHAARSHVRRSLGCGPECHRAELERDRPIRVDADGTVHATDPLGFAIAFASLGPRASLHRS